jgi:hypothetical protein
VGLVGLVGFVGLIAGPSACGFDGVGGVAATTSATEPPADGGSSDRADPTTASAPEGGAGAGTPVTGCSDSTLAFDGIDDVATVPDDAKLDLGDDFTVEAWIKPSGAKVASGVEMDVVSHHDAPASRGWVLLVKDGRAELVVYGNESFSPTAYSAGNAGGTYVTAGKWAHVAGTRRGDMLRIYYDGVLRDTQQLGFLFGRDDYNGALRIGRAAYTEDFRFEGEIDDVRLSTTARYTGATAPRPSAVLSLDDQTEAAWRFDEASGSKLTDASGHAHDGSLAPDETAPTRVASTCIADR